MLKHIIAIDPGAAGGVAFCIDGKVTAQAMPEDEAFIDLVADIKPTHVVAYMEQVQGFIGGKGAPGSAMFNFGNGYGFIRGVLATQGIPCRLIPPQKWMRSVLPGVIGMEYGQRKAALLAYATQLYPELALDEMSKAAGLKLADALVLLEYAKRIEAGGAAPVVIPSRSDYPKDCKRAKKWCKAAGWPVPKGKELLAMVNYWRGIGCPA